MVTYKNVHWRDCDGHFFAISDIYSDDIDKRDEFYVTLLLQERRELW